jgi:hypothetical protein
MKNLSDSRKKELFQILMEEYGYDDEMSFLETECMGGCVPGICTNCECTYDYEPDQDRGWCDECESNTVVSALILSGII